MTYTRHGHHIPGTTTEDERGQIDKARCGGVALCTVCQKDANIAHLGDPAVEAAEFFEDTSEYASDPDRFLKQAKLYVVGSWNNQIEDQSKHLSVENLYIVWFTKALGNWKAMLSTNIPGDGLYFEVTHNGEKEETYVDTYLKITNDKFSQEE